MTDYNELYDQMKGAADDMSKASVEMKGMMTAGDETDVQIAGFGPKPSFSKQIKELFDQLAEAAGYNFLGDYEDGPLQFTARNQYIRYDGQYWKLNAETNVGFTTTGVTAGTWANDVNHLVIFDGDSLRRALASQDDNLGDALLTVKQPYTASVSRSQHNKNADVISVKDFGAIGDGVADDTAAFDNASLASKLSGRSIYVPMPSVKYIYNGAGIEVGSGASLFGENLSTVIDASGNTNSGHLITLTGFRSKTHTLQIKGNPSNPALRGVASYYNSDGGGVSDFIIEDFTFGLDTDRAWYSGFGRIRFRTSPGVTLSGSHLNIGTHFPTDEVNNLVFDDFWLGGNQETCVSVQCPVQNIKFHGGSFETTGTRIKFGPVSVNTFTLDGVYLEADTTTGVYLAEGASLSQRVSLVRCMGRFGPGVGSLGKNITVDIVGGYYNCPNVTLNQNNTVVNFAGDTAAINFADFFSQGAAGEWDGTARNAQVMRSVPRMMSALDFNAVIPTYTHYKEHANNTPLGIFNVFIPPATDGAYPRLMLLEVTAITKPVGSVDPAVQGLEKYLIAITLPQTSAAGSGVLVTKIVSQAAGGATLLADPGFTVVDNGYDATADALKYTIQHTVVHPTRLGRTMFTLTGAYSNGPGTIRSQRWMVQKL